MATLNSASLCGTAPSPGRDVPSPPPETSSSSSSGTSDPVTKDPPDAPSTSESVRSSEPGGKLPESSCGLIPPKDTGEPQVEPGCGHIPPRDLGVEKEEEEAGTLPLDLSNHLFFAAGGKAYLLAKLPLPGGSELLLPKGFPWDEASTKEEPGLPRLARFPRSPLTILHIQHGFDPIQGFSSSDQILSHDTSAPSLAACEGRDGAFWSYQLVPNPTEDPKDGPMGSRRGDHRALFWICLPCRLGFGRLRAFIGHTRSHGAKLSPAHHQSLLGSPAILQEGDDGGVAFLSLLEPKPLTRPSEVPEEPNSSTVTMEASRGQTEHALPEADHQALVLPSEELMALSPPSPPTALATWDPSPTQAKESPVSRGEAGPDWFPEGQEMDGGFCLPLNQSSPTSKEVAMLPAPAGSPEDTSDPPQACRLVDDYAPAPAAFQGLSLSSHMSLLHSRNSCKTLKCPKCNWHYKYQQTLDVHMREKHPESNSHCSYCSAGGAHPRLARGESYNCGYKPYRCDVCNYSTTTKGNLSIHMQSDKHLANLQGFQAGPGGQGSPPEASLPPPSAGDKEPKTKSSWQCKVCSYETNISRNLRIHMTSEKHLQNVLMLHQGLPLGLPPGLVGPGPPPPPGASPANPPELFQYFGPQALGQPQTPMPGPGLRPDKPLEAQLLLNGFHHLGAPTRKFPTAAPGSLSPDTHLPPSQLLGSSSDGLPTSPSPDDSPPLKVFRCLVCQAFSTDSLELLLYHCSIGRSLPEAEWKEVAGDTHRCKLCCYGTQLKANFQLHLKTDKHTQKYQLAAHLREGGGAVGTPSPLSLGDGASYGSVSPLHLRCNICDFESNSKEKMQLHARGSAHEENSQIYKFLLEMEGAEAGPEPGLYRCLLCAWDTPSRLAVLQHLRTPSHRDAQAQRRLQLLQNGPPAEEGLSALQGTLSFSRGRLRTPGKAPDTPLAQPPTSEKDGQNKTEQLASEVTEDRTGPPRDSANQITVYCCPYCSFLSPESDQVRVHTVSQHAVQPKYRCPLCQEQLVGRPALHFHLSHLHNVVPECVEKLLLVATTVEMTFATKMLPGPTLSPVEDGLEHPSPGPEPTPSRDQVAENANLTPEASPVPPPEPPLAPVEGPEKPSGSPGQPSSPTPSPVPQLDAQVEEMAPPPAMAEEEEGAMGEPRSAEPSAADSRHPLTYRKTTNFALDKFLDPARPYKCTVCKESFTQKNILLVHYNSVSHLHKMKKAASDPSCPARGEAGIPAPSTAASDKPFKCTVCRVSYNQSSTLEIHMRSVLHQTRSRGAKTDAKAEGPERSQEEVKEGETEGEVGTEKKGPDPAAFMSGLPFLSPPAPPLDLHRFPAPLFTPPVLPPFPLVPESLLKLQQQQLLLPFYLHDLKVGPKLALASPTPMLSLPAATPPPLPAPPKAELPEQEWERPLIAEEGNEAGPSSPPHPSPNEAARTAAKALLENFGFELVIQYNEGKQAVPPPPTPPPPESLGGGDKLACGACGKLFSNMLILKTHEEHVHRRFLPFEALSRYAAQFRKSYDSLYPPPPAEPPKPPDGSLESPPQLGPPFVVPEPEVGGIHTSEERSLAGGHWPAEEEEGSRGTLPPTVPAAGRRFSRTKFTEFQSQALQSFFETSAYPKDGEVERLANLLGLASRVVVVWFQNARQKARKNACEGGPVASGGAPGGASGCRRCHATFACIFELVRHLKKCYDDQPPEEEEEAEKAEEEEEVEEEELEERNPEPAARHSGPSPEHADVEDSSQQAEPTRPEGKESEGKAPPSPPVHTCDQCAISFPSQDLLSAHHRLHFLPPSVQPSAPSQLLDLPLLVFGERTPAVSGTSSGTPLKRKHDDGSLSPTGSEAGGGGDGEPPKDKRLRTTILPEQLEILYRWYMQDSNPTRKMLDCISEEVGLKKRVVQVWFQNTRARERKGQFRSTPGGVAGPAVKPTVNAAPAPFPKFNLLLSKMEDETGKETPKREAPAFPYPAVTPAAGPLPSLQPGKEATAPPPEPPLPLPPPALSEDEGPEEPPKASPESEACSPSAGDLSDSSASSLAEPESPGAGGTSGGPGGGTGVPDGMGQRRYRTQMSSLQLKIMKACYEAYRTPTMQECEVLGEEIGLPKRVIQVWFQNARAKEKKAKLQGAAIAGSGSSSEGALAAQRTDCPYCDVKYDFYVSCRGHLFSRQHLAKLKEAVRAQLKSESKCYDLAPAPEAPPLAPKGPPATTPASVPLGASPTLPRLAPVLLPGPTLAQPPLGSIASFNSGTAASSGLLGLATSVLPATTVVQTAGPGRPLPQRPASNQTNSSTDPTPGPATEPSGDKVSGERKPVATLTNSSTDALKNLKALKATVPALLGGQFLPFPLPPTGGAAPPAVFGPQLQGAYFQQLYGMKKGLFPMNPVIPQTLIGLLPNTLLQQPPQAPEPTATAPPKPPELSAPEEGESSEADELLTGSAGISTVDVTHRYLCRQCKMAFDGEAPAAAHQRSFCFFGRGSGASMPAPLRVPICTYHCLACEVLLSGREALASHLRSSAHRRKAAPPPGGPPITVTNSATAVPAAVAFAKEEARLPHTDPNPKTTTTSTLLAL
ncbi:LOW QUALITY PROTEIN: zinc finger homeobox protein 2 [Acomys russatus]|uniref:LOW QUALITY PROTEIN: zinc finger homeobox protein 2 n=1 Tax=Acomys russatus TaxID=60746 RepID=UPI0021E1E906|nr:LOW QUALITY PROTEIN: zinc finger homeobox protein 2 [Acomys russatus]